jgi:hypothetical protein
MGDKADPVFFVLGFLADSLGRHLVEGSDRVETLGRNEEAKAAILRRALRAIARGQHFDAKIVEEQDDVNLQFRSAQIAALIDSCYSYRQGSDGWVQDPNGTMRRMTDAVLSSSLFVRGGRYDAGLGLPFISGAYARFGENGAFRFPGRPVKAQIIAELLANLHCRDVRIESTVGLIPGATYVRFEPTPEVSAALAAPTVW